MVAGALIDLELIERALIAGFMYNALALQLNVIETIGRALPLYIVKDIYEHNKAIICTTLDTNVLIAIIQDCTQRALRIHANLEPDPLQRDTDPSQVPIPEHKIPPRRKRAIMDMPTTKRSNTRCE